MPAPLTLEAVTSAPDVLDHGRHSHGLDTTAGYALAITAVRGDGTVGREYVEVLPGDTRYGRALERRAELVAELRAGTRTGTYAVVDTLYVCGCVGR